MHLIRQLAAYEMLAHEDQYATFLPAIEGPLRTMVPEEHLTVPLVVGHLVVADGVEAEHVMIQAVATLLGLCLAVVYADGQANPKVRSVTMLLSSVCWLKLDPNEGNTVCNMGHDWL